MSRFVPNATIDVLLDKVATATLMSVVSDTDTPTDLTNTLAAVAVAPGDFSIADAAGGGRELTIASKSGVEITTGGTAKHVVLSLSNTILAVTTCTTQSLVDNDSNTVTFPEWTHTVSDPS